MLTDFFYKSVGSLQISGDLKEVGQNGEGNEQTQTVELHSVSHLVTR